MLDGLDDSGVKVIVELIVEVIIAIDGGPTQERWWVGNIRGERPKCLGRRARRHARKVEEGGPEACRKG